jgi:hypothetical protein
MRRKIIPYILIVTIFLGGLVFVGVSDVRAVAQPTTGTYSAVNLIEKQKEATNNTGEPRDLESRLNSCGVLIQGTLSGCIQGITYILFVTIPSFIASVAGVFFDMMLGLTVQSSIYNQDFILKIWGVLRDLGNIAFILVLLYAAFQIILESAGEHGGKTMVAHVIVIALLVNFSLFFTKIIIDASNILALIFYNSIDVAGNSDNPAKQKPISGALVSKFNPNEFFEDDFLDKTVGSVVGVALKEAERNECIATAGRSLTEDAKKQRQDCVDKANEKYKGVTEESDRTFALVSLMIPYGLILYVLCYTFLVVGLSFLGRTLTLIMLMIISPLAFISYATPKGLGSEQLDFNNWLKKLTSTSFMAAVFIFILYIISTIMENINDFKVGDSGSLDPTERLVTVFLPAIMICVLLLKGAEHAKKASGDFTEKIFSGAKMLTGVGLGGMAVVGTNVFGRAASSLSESEWLKNKSLGGGLGGGVAKLGLGAVNLGAKSSFDFRQTGAGKIFKKLSGVGDSGAVVKALGLETKTFKGGAKKWGEEPFKKSEKKQREKMKQLELSPEAAKKQNEKNEDWNKKYKPEEEKAKTKHEKDWKEKYEKDREDEMRKKFGNKILSPEEKDTFHKEYDKENKGESESKMKSKWEETKKNFKKDYEGGKDLSKYGEGDSLVGVKGNKDGNKSADEVNKERSQAYRASLAPKNSKEYQMNKARQESLKKGDSFNEVKWKEEHPDLGAGTYTTREKITRFFADHPITATVAVTGLAGGAAFGSAGVLGVGGIAAFKALREALTSVSSRNEILRDKISRARPQSEIDKENREELLEALKNAQKKPEPHPKGPEPHNSTKGNSNNAGGGGHGH